MKRGLFISVEGIEGVGKSTNIEFVERYLTEAGKTVLVTREPGGTELAEKLRDLVLNPQLEVSALTELLLVFAGRADHVTKKIRPAVEQGTFVICDRFTDASLAYQGGGRGIDRELIYQLAAVCHGDLWPDLTLLLDAPEADALKRAHSRSEPDRFEQESQAFFQRVRQAYLELATTHPNRIQIIDASQSLSEVQTALTKTLDQVLGDIHE
ncbi:MAG: dTMP kinase [Gammaproteobacteria bacterium]|nr:dTMP kinase [Gammaproteobacteria bacterium]